MNTNQKANTFNFANIPMGGFFTWNPFIPYQTDPDNAESKDERDGCTCTKCKNFSPYATPNQEDKSFVCFGCRNGY